MFVDTDTNKDDLANGGFFSKFVDMAAFIPGMYGYAPTDVELYETEDEKEQARRKMFNSMGPGVMTVDEWLQFSVEYIIAKVATLAANPILNHRNAEESKAFNEAALAIDSPEYVGMHWFLLKSSTGSDLLQHEDQYGSRDVSPLDDADDGHRGALSHWEDQDLHGAREGRRGEETREERSHATMRLYACA